MERLGTTKSAYKFEKLLAVFGFLLLAIYGLARMYQMFASPAEVRRFWEAQEAPRVQASQPDKREPDFRLWSPQRIAAYKTGLSDGIPTPIAVLQITSVGLEVPVLEGTADATLDQGAGHIEGTLQDLVPTVISESQPTATGFSAA
jgi:sortase (surface protein transpeptidase)